MKVDVTVVASKTYKATVDVDAFVKVFEMEWKDYIENEDFAMVDDDTKREFIKDSIHEMGTDFFEVDAHAYMKSCYTDTDLEVEIDQ